MGEFVPDGYGGGEWSWESVTPEGGILRPDEYAEEAIPVPADRVQYLQGAGFLDAEEDEDYRAYVDKDVFTAHGRNWQRVVLKGHISGVQNGMHRLMAGVLRRRPWEQSNIGTELSPE